MRLSTAVWWPGASKDVEKFVKRCQACQKKTVSPTGPLITSSLPSYPWQHVASDLLELKCTTYLFVVDYYSKIVETQQLTSTTSPSVVTSLRAIFARHGISTTLITDNGPRYSSSEIKEFANAYMDSAISSAVPTTHSPMDTSKGVCRQ